MNSRARQIVNEHIDILYDMVEQGNKQQFLENLVLSDMIWNVLDTKDIDVAISYIKILHNAIEKWIKED